MQRQTTAAVAAAAVAAAVAAAAVRKGVRTRATVQTRRIRRQTIEIANIIFPKITVKGQERLSLARNNDYLGMILSVAVTS